jgi:YHS domain-containing protein
MPASLLTELGEARELDLALVIADQSGYTAFTETHGALYASEIVLRFQRRAAASFVPGVRIVNSIGERRFRNVARSVPVFELARVGAEGRSSVIDPVCRMQVEISRAVATIAHSGATYHFCSLRCAGDFAKAPQLYTGTP